ncbi:MAG: hypothetical protein HOP15_11575, partial [Planctomycetes bacterium]|nr:hypothetical protein [Planctomycetota bacterium]
ALDLVHWSGKFARRDIGLPRSARPSGTDTQAGLESFGVFTSGARERDDCPL